MNVLLLGNGFDIQYHLPTKYNNFLHTLEYLINNTLTEPLTVGDVFSSKELQEKDAFIAECYEANKEVFHKTVLDIKKLGELIKLAESNVWFKYLLNSFNKDVGWIDFEREIATVINLLRDFLYELDVEFYENYISKFGANKYIVEQFAYYYTQTHPESNINGIVTSAQYKVNDEYVLEYPLGSKAKILNLEKIIKKLSDELNALANALKLYLSYFVESVLSEENIDKHLQKCKSLLHNDYVVTLNYTHTFQKIYLNNDVFHLHGNVDNEIVLGINPDMYDESGSIDTSFIAFKKYYQRTMYDTDAEYIKWLTVDSKVAGENFHLLVMGHSLDVTDEDIIKSLFERASKITILYHNKTSKSSYIGNLVKIYGKNGFDVLRERQNLTFLPLSMDFSEFEKFQINNSHKYHLSQIDSILYEGVII